MSAYVCILIIIISFDKFKVLIAFHPQVLSCSVTRSQCSPLSSTAWSTTYWLFFSSSLLALCWSCLELTEAEKSSNLRRGKGKSPRLCASLTNAEMYKTLYQDGLPLHILSCRRNLFYVICNLSFSCLFVCFIHICYVLYIFVMLHIQQYLRSLYRLIHVNKKICSCAD